MTRASRAAASIFYSTFGYIISRRLGVSRPVNPECSQAL
jgi:hypothetical protein